jgi:ADP-heptose:LPS heptosyltransferase
MYLSDDYAAWRRKRAASPGAIAWMKRHVGCFLDQPSIALFMKLSAEAELAALFMTTRSLQEQVYPHWRLYVSCDQGAFEKLGESLGRLTAQDSRIDVHVEPPDDAVDSSGSVCARVQDDLWGLIDAGNFLDPNALFEIVYKLNQDPHIDFIYTDEDTLVGREARDFPVLKPDWSSELLASSNGIGRLWLARQRLLPEAVARNSTEERGLLLELTQKAQKIGHIKSILYGRHRPPGQIRPMAAHYSMRADAETVVACAPLPLLKLDGIENILVVMLDHLGDVLLTFPAIERLRQMFPQAHITALVGSWSKSLARGNESIDEILTYDFFDASSAEPHRRIDAAEADRIEQWLSPGGFDLAVDFRREPETRDFLRLSRARYTAGFAQGREAAWLTVALPCEPNVQWLRPRRHVAQELIHLVEMIGVAGRADIRPCVATAPGEDFAVKELLVAALPDDGRLLVAIHPGSGRSIKCWPAEHFARLADRLIERLKARIVWFGSKNETALVDSILERMRFRSEAVSLAGQLSIAQLAAAFRHFDLFIGNDSGPAHLAAGTAMPTLCICSGTIDPIQWAPLGPAALVVYRLMTCSPCYLRDREECPFEVACLRELGVEDVWEAAVRTLLPRWHKLVHTPEFAQARGPEARRAISEPADVSASFPSV